jgi:phage shock protein E
MSTVVYGIMLLLVALVFVFVTYVFIERMYPHDLRITAKEASELIQTHGAKVVDVRTKTEWDTGHFPSAIHIPASRIKQLAPKKLDRTDTIIVYCNTGTRARNAAIALVDLGYPNVRYIAETYHEL